MTSSVLVIALLAAAVAGVITSLLVPLLVRVAEALRANGKPVELALFDKAGHGFHRWQVSTHYRLIAQ